MKGENESISFPGLHHDVNWNNTPVSKAFSKRKTSKTVLPDDNPSLHSSCFFIDHFDQQFACISEIGNNMDERLENRRVQDETDFHTLYFHPDDRMIWNKEIFPDILRFVDSVAVEDLSDYRLIFNHRYIRKDGSISQFMHEGSVAFIEDRGLPLIKLNVFAEIGDFKTDETMILTIFRDSADLGYQKIFTKVYGEMHNSPLSPRELEIIRLCHEGLSSKMIAERLNLSIHTIKNHKRHCMAKTSTHNISELIHFCIKSHWM